MKVKPSGAKRWWLGAGARFCLALGAARLGRACWCRLLRAERCNVDALAGLAYAQASRGRLAGALRWQQRLVHLLPTQASAWYNLGYLLEQLQHLEAATVAFAQAVELVPALDTAWYGLGTCLHRLGRPQEALQALERNTALQPWSPHGYRERVHVLAGLGRWVEVGRLIEHLQGFEPRTAAALEQQYGSAYASSGWPA